MSNYAPNAGPLASKSAGTLVSDTLTVLGAAQIDGALAVDGALTAGSIIAPIPAAPVIKSAAVGATIVLLASQNGALCINASTSGSPQFTLPAAAAGLTFTFSCANATEGMVIATPVPATNKIVCQTQAVSGASLVNTKIETSTDGLLTHTQGTAIVGDFVRLTCDGVLWVTVGFSGVFAAT